MKSREYYQNQKKPPRKLATLSLCTSCLDGSMGGDLHQSPSSNNNNLHDFITFVFGESNDGVKKKKSQNRLNCVIVGENQTIYS
jgi:hypothetical protein